MRCITTNSIILKQSRDYNYGSSIYNYPFATYIFNPHITKIVRIAHQRANLIYRCDMPNLRVQHASGHPEKIY